MGWMASFIPNARGQLVLCSRLPQAAFKVSSYIIRAITDEGSEFNVGAALPHQTIPAHTRNAALGDAGVLFFSEKGF